jgi:sugar/nucleoside kinase (ribokinase family)
MAGSDGRRVVVVGPVNIDLFMRGSAPLDGALLRRWVGPSDVQLVVAGSVGYTVQVFQRLGCRVELCTTTGRDAFGAFLRTTLEAAGIGLRHTSVADGDTAIALYVLLFGDAKRPMTYRLPGFEPWPDPLPRFVDDIPPPHLVHCGGLLHFPGMWHRGLRPAFEAARRSGVMTSLDPQFPLTDLPAPWLPHLVDVLPATDILLMDEGECRMVFGVDSLVEAIGRAHELGPRIVTIKRGADGAIVSDGTSILRQPAIAIPEERVREAVGAGDAFDAAFLDALLRGATPAVAVRDATAVAALSLGGRGGAEGIADLDAVHALVDHVPSQVTWSEP